MTHQPGVYVPLRALFLVFFGLTMLSCSTQLSMKFIILINVKMSFMSRIND